MNQELLNHLARVYQDQFGHPEHAVRVFSPGRINVLGEHVDYNDGAMMPAAIHLGIYLIAERRKDQKIHLYADKFSEQVVVDASKPMQKSETGWANYIIGVVVQFQKKGIAVPGFNLVFQGDLPVGAGLSSSAALENGVAVLLDHFTQSGLSKMELLQMAQKAEHEFAGVMCGIMDQFASMMGKTNQLVVIDSADLSFEWVPIQMQGYRFVLLDSRVKHSLANSGYNTRRKEAEEALQSLREAFPEVTSYKHARMDQLATLKEQLAPNVFSRAKFVIEEMARVKQAKEALQNHEIQQLGKLMYATHQGLSADYEVSCEELDFLCDLTKREPDVIGSRMMGGGFGGCTINLIREKNCDEVLERLVVAYQTRFGQRPNIIEVHIADGTRLI